MTPNSLNHQNFFSYSQAIPGNDKNSEDPLSLKRPRDPEEVVDEVGREIKKQKNDDIVDVSEPIFSSNTLNEIPSPPRPKIEKIKGNPLIENLVFSGFKTTEMQIEEPKLEPMPFQINETLKHILSQLSPKDLLPMRLNNRYKMITESLLIERLNNEEITLNDIGIKTLDAAIDFFGKRCSEILCLNLEDDFEIKNEDMEKISNYFPKLNKLHLLNASITNESKSSFKDLSELTHLTLIVCDCITNFSFLADCPKLTHLNIDLCDGLDDISFLERCLELDLAPKKRSTKK